MLRRVLFCMSFVILMTGYSQVGKVLFSEARSVPKMLNYQGYLTDTLGSPIDDSLDMTFKIFDAATLGNELWFESHLNVPVERGVFCVLLGSGASIPDTVFTQGSDRWLELTLEGPQTLSPRTRITAMGYAYTSTYSDTAEYTKSAMADTDWVISGTDMYSGVSGKVGIGTTDPQYSLDISEQTGNPTLKLTHGGGGTISKIMSNYYEIVDAGNTAWLTLRNTYTGSTSHYGSIKLETKNGDIVLHREGNVGIGTTSPDYKLDIYDGGVNVTDPQNTYVQIRGNTTGDYFASRVILSRAQDNRGAGLHITADDDQAWWIGVPYQGGGITFGRHSSEPYLKGNSLMFINESGNVGIGTTSPEDILSIDAGTNSEGLGLYGNLDWGTHKPAAFKTTNQYLRIIPSNTNYGRPRFYGGSTSSGNNMFEFHSYGRYNHSGDDYFTFDAHQQNSDGSSGSINSTSNLVNFLNNGNSTLIVKGNGNVGIGTTSPSGKLHVDSGDLVVTDSGAFRGDIGPNNGAPFPRPAYDSGWRGINPGTELTLTHNIGGNVGNYVVDLQFKDNDYYGINQQYYGGDRSNGQMLGVWWQLLTANTIQVSRPPDEAVVDSVRVRIWVYY